MSCVVGVWLATCRSRAPSTSHGILTGSDAHDDALLYGLTTGGCTCGRKPADPNIFEPLKLEDVSWGQETMQLSVVLPEMAPEKERYWCFNRTYRAIKEGLGGWEDKCCLLLSHFSLTIADRQAVGRLVPLKNWLLAAFAYKNVVVKGLDVAVVGLNATPTNPQHLAAT